MNTCQLCERALYGDAAAYLCPGCTRATAERLDALPGLYTALALFLAPAPQQPGPSTAGSPEPPMPCAELPLSLRGPGGILGVVEDWRSAMHADLGWTQPRVSGSYEERLARAVAGLRNNVLWIASSWPAAGTFAEELREAERLILSIVDPVDPRDRARRLGLCPKETGDGRCGAVVRLHPGQSVAVCRWCGAEYAPTHWLALAAAQVETRDIAARRLEAS